MLIAPVVNASSWLVSQIGQLGSASQTANTNANPLSAQPGIGPSATALQALSQVGVHVSAPAAGAVAPDGSPTTQNEAQALQAFMHNLFAALQSQGAATQTQGDASVSSLGAASGHRAHFHGAGHMQQEVQGLIQNLGSGTAASSSTSASGASLASLQQSFQSLVSASGSSAGNPTLSGFLSAFQHDLPSLGSVGNILNTQA